MPRPDMDQAPSHLTDFEVAQLREAQLRGILASASEGILTINAKQTIVMANRAAADMFGRSVAALVGAPLSLLIPQRFHDAHASQVAAFGASDPAPRRMGMAAGIVGLRADGEEFPLEAGISVAHVDGTRLSTVILRDLSEARRAEAALQSSEDLLAATFRAGSVGIAQVDVASRRFVAVNAAFCALTGHDESELRRMGLDSISHPQAPLDETLFAALLDGTAGYRVEQRLATKDGREVWVEVEASLIRDRAGRPLRVLALIRDITARRVAENDLHARAAHQSFLVQLNDRLRDLRDPHRIATEATRMVGEFAGVSRVAYAEDDGNDLSCTFTCGHALGVPTIEGVHRLADYGAAMLGELRSGRTVVIDDILDAALLGEADRLRREALGIRALVNVPVHGATRRAALLVHNQSPRHWTPGEVGLFEEVAQRMRSDIERARASNEARANRDMLQAALAAMNDSVYISDVDGRCITRNTAFHAFHRFRDPQDAPVDLRRLTEVLDILLPDGTVAPTERWPVLRALAGETGSNLELGMRRRDTGEQWAGSYSFAPVRDAAGRIIGAVVVGRDVTDLKRMHDELEAAHADLLRLLAEQDRVQDQERLRIARELHDDMLQRLATILMEASLLRGRLLPSKLPADQALTRIEHLAAQSITSARRIVHDLRPQALDELGLAAALVDLGARFSQSSGVACQIDAPDLDNADAARLAPVATSLYRIAQEALANVAKHAGAQRVDVTIDLVRGAPDRVRMCVRDDGVGMRADSGRRPGAFGLLGMRERVRAAGGSLDIHSGPGAGTTLMIEMPIAPADTSGAAERGDEA